MISYCIYWSILFPKCLCLPLFWKGLNNTLYKWQPISTRVIVANVYFLWIQMWISLKLELFLFCAAELSWHSQFGVPKISYHSSFFWCCIHRPYTGLCQGTLSSINFVCFVSFLVNSAFNLLPNSNLTFITWTLIKQVPQSFLLSCGYENWGKFHNTINTVKHS